MLSLTSLLFLRQALGVCSASCLSIELSFCKYPHGLFPHLIQVVAQIFSIGPALSTLFTCNSHPMGNSGFPCFFFFQFLLIVYHHLRHLYVLVTQSCPTLLYPMDCSPPGSSVHGISQVRILEWVAISFSRGSSRPRDQTQISCITDRFFTT